MIEIKSRREIELMRRAGMIVAETIHVLCKESKPGITTGELGDIAAEVIYGYGAESAFLNYTPAGSSIGFPGVVCISVNEEVVHGIPGKRVLQEGDLVSFDVGTRLDGYCGDGAGSVVIGDNVSERVLTLMDITKQCLHNGIDSAVEGNRISDIGRAVQITAESAGMGVVRALVGHGIGRDVHEDPQVPNYIAPGFSPRIKPGMVIAIEPMITLGDWRVKELDDEWTIVTADNSLSAHFEHTVAITELGPEILTLRDNGKEGFIVD